MRHGIALRLRAAASMASAVKCFVAIMIQSRASSMGVARSATWRAQNPLPSETFESSGPPASGIEIMQHVNQAFGAAHAIERLLAAERRVRAVEPGPRPDVLRAGARS